MANQKINILESLRGFAAVYVVAHHIWLVQSQKSKIGFVFSQGQAAVMLFFVISGFVIFLSSYKLQELGRFSFRGYFVKRFRRIYPVFIAALILAYLAACIVSKTWMPFDGLSFAGNFLNLQDLKRIPGNFVIPYYRNTPLWSLSYEWWFYMMFFPIFKFVRTDLQKHVALGISLVGFFTFLIYPNKISTTLEYFIIWWTGVELARSWVKHGTVINEVMRFVFGALGLMLLLLAIQLIVYRQDHKLDWSDHPGIQFMHFLYSFLIIAFGLLWKKWKFWGYDYLLKPFLIFAPISYSIYVFHAPLIYKNNVFSVQSVIVQDILGFASVVLLGYLLEVVLQKRINSLTKKFT